MRWRPISETQQQEQPPEHTSIIAKELPHPKLL